MVMDNNENDINGLRQLLSTLLKEVESNNYILNCIQTLKKVAAIYIHIMKVLYSVKGEYC